MRNILIVSLLCTPLLADVTIYESTTPGFELISYQYMERVPGGSFFAENTVEIGRKTAPLYVQYEHDSDTDRFFLNCVSIDDSLAARPGVDCGPGFGPPIGELSSLSVGLSPFGVDDPATLNFGPTSVLRETLTWRGNHFISWLSATEPLFLFNGGSTYVGFIPPSFWVDDLGFATEGSLTKFLLEPEGFSGSLNSPQVVPEPTTFSLFGVACLVGVAVLRRRRYIAR